MEKTVLINDVPEVDIHWYKGQVPDGLIFTVIKGDFNLDTLWQRIGSTIKAGGLQNAYLITSKQFKTVSVYEANNNFPNDNYYASIDKRLGPYDPRLLLLNRLGEPIYLYDFNTSK